MIRKAVNGDLGRIEEIFALARGRMHANGNTTQWTEGYPGKDIIQKDINAGFCRVLEDENGVYGAFSLLPGPDPTYRVIHGGQWLTDGDYGVIHRLASDGVHRGVFAETVRYCLGLFKVLRIDTHKNNRPMIGAVEKAGFRYCGVIYLDRLGDNERLAFELDTAKQNGKGTD